MVIPQYSLVPPSLSNYISLYPSIYLSLYISLYLSISLSLPCIIYPTMYNLPRSSDQVYTISPPPLPNSLSLTISHDLSISSLCYISLYLPLSYLSSLYLCVSLLHLCSLLRSRGLYYNLSPSLLLYPPISSSLFLSLSLPLSTSPLFI